MRQRKHSKRQILWVQGAQYNEFGGAPTQWDNMLKAEGLLESSVVAEAEHLGVVDHRVRTWVRHKCRYKYSFVPEQVLLAMGIDPEVEVPICKK